MQCILISLEISGSKRRVNGKDLKSLGLGHPGSSPGARTIVKSMCYSDHLEPKLFGDSKVKPSRNGQRPICTVS